MHCSGNTPHRRHVLLIRRRFASVRRGFLDCLQELEKGLLQDLRAICRFLFPGAHTQGTRSQIAQNELFQAGKVFFAPLAWSLGLGKVHSVLGCLFHFVSCSVIVYQRLYCQATTNLFPRLQFKAWTGKSAQKKLFLGRKVYIKPCRAAQGSVTAIEEAQSAL